MMRSKEHPSKSGEANIATVASAVHWAHGNRQGTRSRPKPLRDLTQSNVLWVWNEAQQTAFEKLKEMVTPTPVLCYYNLKEEVTLQCDVSKSGLGAALMQNGQPVAYASHALTPTETCYAQIEKELLSIVFACDRFHAFVYGRDLVNVETDHKPLKPLAATPKCL